MKSHMSARAWEAAAGCEIVRRRGQTLLSQHEDQDEKETITVHGDVLLAHTHRRQLPAETSSTFLDEQRFGKLTALALSPSSSS